VKSLRTKVGFSIFLIAVLAFSLPSLTLIALAQPAERVPVIIGFREFQDATLVKFHGGVIKYTYAYILAIAASVPPQALDALQRNPNVAYVETDFEVYALAQTLPSGVQKIRAPEVWDIGNKGTGIKVAIMDTGIDQTHPDLKVYGGVSYVWYTSSYDDDNGHGTHCAGIVAALSNDIGVVGVAPEAYLYAVKVLDRSGSGYLSDLNYGIEWCISKGMQVISMSFGSSSDSISLHQECNKAYNSGIVLVAAAGNSGPGENTIGYPAKYSSVIAVGATDSNDVVASFSSRGPELSVTAPGVSIYSTYEGGIYATMSGTSMACPHVTGTVALILAKAAHTPTEVRDILQTTAIDLGSTGWDSAYGYGRIDSYAAVSVSPKPITVNIVNPTGGTTVKGSVAIQASVKTRTSPIDSVGYAIDADTFTAMTHNPSNGYWEAVWDTTTVADGSHTIKVTAKDTSGNVDEKTITVTVTDIVRALAVAVKTDKAEYKRNSWVYITVTVTDGAGKPLGGASVVVTVYNPGGLVVGVGSGIADSNGVVRFRYKLGLKAPTGTYTVVAIVSLTGYETRSAITTFTAV